MPTTKVQPCVSDECDGVMRLRNVADDIPLWECRKCGTEDTTRGSQRGAARFEREAPGEAYSPFSEDDPDPSMSWSEFEERFL